MARNQFYAVRVGRKPGIYTTWGCSNGAQALVVGFAGAEYRGFTTRLEAEAWLKGPPAPGAAQAVLPLKITADAPAQPSNPPARTGEVIIYTDGGSLGNPGPGGYGVVLLYGSTRKELSGGFRRTTNNRMELTAAIAALEALTRPSQVTLYTDSSYLANGINKGWAARWRRNGWMRTKDNPAENPDLWERLLDLCARHRVTFNWLRGHTGDPENERCDQLVKNAARQPNLPPDPGYEE